jgi:2-polyprenyl-6-methoxyphenol hydroxylase-like FAD-dependent oxidoreductase
MAGMFAARALADHFERVTVIERDTLPEGPEFRKGVPQSRHFHILLVRGKQGFEHFFPGIEADLIAAGAVTADSGSDFIFHSHFGRLASGHTGLETLLCSRHLFEAQVRQRLRVLANVEIRERTTVAGLAGSASAVHGILVKPAAGHGDQVLLEADLVVAANGRGPAAVSWLQALGVPAPEERVVNAGLSYATQWFQFPDGHGLPGRGIVVNGRPLDIPRAAALVNVESDDWIVTLGALNATPAPRDPASFLEFTANLLDPTIAAALQRGEPTSPIYGYAQTENRWRHFEKLPNWPEGLIVLGDAACCFNPIYGQGMTLSVMAAELLEDQLAQAFALGGPGLGPGFSARFQQRLAKLFDVPWLLATSEDFRWPTTTGARPGWLHRQVQRYLDRVIELATQDAAAGQRFLEVLHLLRPPAALFAPGLLWKVVLRAFGFGRE